eukprot:2878918-Amphidinium_carterae.1
MSRDSYSTNLAWDDDESCASILESGSATELIGLQRRNNLLLPKALTSMNINEVLNQVGASRGTRDAHTGKSPPGSTT